MKSRFQKKIKGVWLRRALLVVLGVVLGVNIYAANARVVAGNALPMPFGCGAAVVLSGSMEPTLSKGDLIFVKETDTVKVGDIVVYQAPGELIVHRVIALDGQTVTTQGDANNIADEPFPAAEIKGVVWFHIPAIGTAVDALKTPIGTVLVLILALVLVEMSFRKQKNADEKELEAVKDEIRKLRDELKK